MFKAIQEFYFLVLDTLRGKYSSKAIAWGIVLGMLIGFVPKDSLFVWMISTIVFATRVNLMAAAFASFAFAWAGSYLDPVFYRVGAKILVLPNMQTTFGNLMEQPIVPWTRFNNTNVLGGLATGLVFAWPVYHFSFQFFEFGLPKLRSRLQKFGWLKVSTKAAPAEEKPAKKSLIRWKYVLPRLVVVGLLLAAIQWGTAPFLKYTLVMTGTCMTGAAVDVAKLDASVWHGEMTLSGVQVADPKSPMRNLVSFDEMKINLDSHALLRKRFVVDTADLTGVEFGSARDKSGAIDWGTEPDLATQAYEQSKDWAGNYLENWFSEQKAKVKNMVVQESETYRTAQALIDKYPAEYKALKGRIDELETRVRGIRDAVQTAKQNPLRYVDLGKRLPGEVQTIMIDVDRLYADVDTLIRNIPNDRDAILLAKDRDLAKLKNTVRTTKIDGEAIAKNLAGEKQIETIKDIHSWLKWFDETFPHPKNQLRPTRQGGVDVHFANETRLPLFLVKQANFSARTTRDKKDLEIAGKLQGLTSHPKLLGEPLEIQFETTGDAKIHIQAEIDHHLADHQRRLTVKLPNLNIPMRTLGSAETIALKIPESEAEITAFVTLFEDQIEGTISIKPEPKPLELVAVDKSLGGETLRELLTPALANVQDFDMTLHLSGPRKKPDVKLESSVGPALAQEFNGVMDRSIDLAIDKAKSELDKIVIEKLNELEAKAGEVKELVAIIETYESQLSGLRNTVANSLNTFRLR